jgi:recombination protein RecR
MRQFNNETMKFPSSIQNLIDKLTDLPSVGPKTAERYVFYLLQQSPAYLEDLARKTAELKKSLKICRSCLAVSESDPCPICTDKNRDETLLCLVENTRDMLTIESGNSYNGLYFILGGTINTIEGAGPEKLNGQKLMKRVKENDIKEIILALNPTVEGETTVMYISKQLKEYNIKLTRLARGLPNGSDLEYIDEITMSNALKYRNSL